MYATEVDGQWETRQIGNGSAAHMTLGLDDNGMPHLAYDAEQSPQRVSIIHEWQEPGSYSCQPMGS